jgi:PAS domain-containing protein
MTEHNRMVEALRTSEARYRSLCSCMDEGFCLIEMLFDEYGRLDDFRFLETNHAFEEQCGISNVLGKRIRELFPALDPHWFDILGQVALTGESIRFEREFKTMNGLFNLLAFRMGDAASRTVAVLFTDTTVRKGA